MSYLIAKLIKSATNTENPNISFIRTSLPKTDIIIYDNIPFGNYVIFATIYDTC